MTPEPEWIELEDCLVLHESSIARFGGTEGIRDEGLLKSAISRPRHVFAYEEAGLFALAAVLASGIIRNHPFLDGNKRTGFLAAALFLEINGESFAAPEIEVVERTLALAARAIEESDYRDWLERSCRPS